MKHIFIVNPKSGKCDNSEYIKSQLEGSGFDFEVYTTKAPLDAVEFIKQWCTSNDEEVRFYACGGDGTLNEVVNGAVLFPNASVSCYPCGSGNDFVKYYGGKENFSDITELCRSENHTIDLIRVNDKVYSANVVNFGFDACAARTMDKVRKAPIIGGRNAYATGVAAALVKAMKNHAKIIADGETICADKFMLCTVANGKYVGGSYQCAPRSLIDDGLLEVCMVKPISYLKFAKLIKPYSKGMHLDDPMFNDIVVYRRCRTVEIHVDMGFAVSVDGEIYEGEQFKIEAVPSALRFGVPQKAAAYIKKSEPCTV